MPLVLDGDTGIVGVLLTDANGNVTFDTNTLYVDAPNNRVGIGNTAPERAVDVRINTTTAEPIMVLRQLGSGDASLRLQTTTSPYGFILGVDGSDSDKFKIAVGADDVSSGTAMTIDTSGNVGIGSTSPESQLTISRSNSALYSTLRFTNSGASGRQYEIGIGGSTSAAGFANNLYFYDSTASSNRMVISSSGYVGIGTGNPSEKLHIKSGGDAYKMLLLEAESGSGDAGILLQGDGGNQFNIQQPGGSAGLFFYDRTNTAYRMYIDASGNVGINTTNPETTLHANGATLIRDRAQITPNGANYNSGASRFAGGAALEVITDNANSSGLMIANSTGYSHTWFNYTDGNNYITGDTTNDTGDTIIRSFSGGPSAPTYTERMRVKGSNGYVGIGTDNPQTPLHIETNSAGIAAELRLKNLQSNRETRLSFWDENNINQMQLQYDNGGNRSVLTTNGNGLTVYSSQAGGEIARFGLPGGGNSYISSYFTGDVLIGGTIPSSSYGLEIQKSDAGAGLYLHRKDTAAMNGAGIYHAYQITQTNGQSARLAEITALGVSNWGGALTFATKPANGTPNNSATTRMTIDQDGAVFTPYQPGFHVSNNVAPSTSNLSGDSTLLHFDVVVHTDGNWSTSNKRYTIPKSGKYLIYGQVRFDGATSYSRCYVSVNGASGWWSPGLHTIYDNTSTSYRSHTVSGVLNLSANDYIELRGGTNNSSGTHQGEGSFGAHFLG